MYIYITNNNMTTSITLPEHLKLENIIKAFNPTMTKEEAEKKAMKIRLGFTITNVTPEGYGN